MSTTLNELLGDELIQHNESDQQIKTLPTNELQGKTVAIYFSAHWCPPCKKFTPMLAKLYKELNDEQKGKFDIIFVSSDENDEAFQEYYKDMPWKALPYADRDRKEKLGEKFQLSGIPTLVILSPSGETIHQDAVEEVRINPTKALEKYLEGKTLFWTREAKEGEHVWENGKCGECLMSPLVGARFGSLNDDSALDLCQTCFDKQEAKDSYFEYLIPKKKYSLEKFLSSIPYLLQPGKDEHVPVKSILSNELKSIGFYFSAHWCPPCQTFTPKLAELYKEVQQDTKGFEVLFLSCDQDEDEFNEYRAEMPWLTAPLNTAKTLPAYFQISVIPALIVLSSDGKILARDGRGGVGNSGVDALKTWARGEKLPKPTPEQYVWESVTCDGCRAQPLTGLRYCCTTCGNYDLCSECQKKGHEHELTLEPPPEDEDEN